MDMIPVTKKQEGRKPSLNHEQVRELQRLSWADKNYLAQRFGVCRKTIYKFLKPATPEEARTLATAKHTLKKLHEAGVTSVPARDAHRPI